MRSIIITRIINDRNKSIIVLLVKVFTLYVRTITASEHLTINRNEVGCVQHIISQVYSISYGLIMINRGCMYDSRSYSTVCVSVTLLFPLASGANGREY